MTIRTFIWGSCVSRDTFEFLPDSYELLGYVARQSWISAGNVAADVTIGEMSSDFQRRMTEGDAAGDAMDRIEAKAEQTDLLLLDLCDERLGILELEDGSVVTRSVEKIGNGAQTVLDDDGRAFALGDPLHFERWRVAAAAIRDWLAAQGLLAKTVVLAPEWALFDDEAKPSPTSFGMGAVEVNGRYEPYYDALEALGFQLVRLGPTLAASEHKWGRAPFHFHDSIYRALVGAIVGRGREGTHPVPGRP